MTRRHPPSMLFLAGVPSTFRHFLMPHVRHLQKAGWRVDGGAHALEDDDVATRLDHASNVPWTRRPRDRVNWTAAVTQVRRLVETRTPDLVHVHDPVAAFVTRYALRDFDGYPQVLYTAHGLHAHPRGRWHTNFVFAVAERWAARWTDDLMLINDEDAALASRWPVRHGVHRVPGIGVDLQRYRASASRAADVHTFRASLGLDERQPLMVMLAELNPEKRHRDVLYALTRVKHPSLRVAFAGVGPEQTRLGALARRLGVASRVSFLGFRSDVPVLLQASTALLLPSEREGLPRSIMEGMGMNVPAIVADVRGSHELIQPDRGWLHAVGDRNGLAAAMDEAASDPSVVERKGARARQAVRAYGLAAVLAAYDAVYDAALGRAKAPAATPGVSYAASSIVSDGKLQS